MAIFSETPFTLKDGRQVLLRSPQEGDTQALLEHGKSQLSMPGADDFQVLTLDEFAFTLEQEKQWISTRLEDPNRVAICAFDQSKLIGMLHIDPLTPRKRMCHVALLGMGVDTAYQGKGLGAGLLNAALNWTYSHPHYEKIQLHVVASNAPAMGLYYKFGFQEEGRLRDQIKIAEGEYRDDIIMSLQL